MLRMYTQGTAEKQSGSTESVQRSGSAPLHSLAMKYEERADVATHPLAKHILITMARKKTNLCVAADITDADKLLELAREIGPYICVLKIHVDIITNFSREFIAQLKDLATEFDFLIFEDRKFADIGNTVQQQYGGGVYKIADWAHIVNAHSLPGDGVLSGLKSVVKDRTDRGIMLVAEMSSKGNLCSKEYSAASVAMAQRNPEIVMGFICQQRLTDDPGVLHFTPGIQFASPGDTLGQQYRTPEQAFADGIDVIIVGRGITEPANGVKPLDAARLYQAAGWVAYEARVAASRGLSQVTRMQI